MIKSLATGKGYSVYKVLVTQSGVLAPTVTILEDSVKDIVWSRSDVGTYLLSKTNGFPENKTIPIDDIYIDQNGNKYTLTWTNSGVLTLKTYASTDFINPADDILTNRYLYIEVYK